MHHLFIVVALALQAPPASGGWICGPYHITQQVWAEEVGGRTYYVVRPLRPAILSAEQYVFGELSGLSVAELARRCATELPELQAEPGECLVVPLCSDDGSSPESHPSMRLRELSRGEIIELRAAYSEVKNAARPTRQPAEKVWISIERATCCTLEKALLFVRRTPTDSRFVIAPPQLIVANGRRFSSLRELARRWGGVGLINGDGLNEWVETNSASTEDMLQFTEDFNESKQNLQGGDHP